MFESIDFERIVLPSGWTISRGTDEKKYIVDPSGIIYDCRRVSLEKIEAVSRVDFQAIELNYNIA